MILVDGEKYACEQCIRGHRSSTCKHIKRRLVLVRSRGRPITDSSQRIAIMAEEVARSSISNSDSKVKTKGGKNLLENNKRNYHEDNKSCRRTKCSCCARASLVDSNTSSSASSSLSIKSEHSSNTSAASSASCSCEAECAQVAHEDSVFVLRASKRRIYNVDKTSLKLLEPVAEIPNNRVGLEMMHNISRIKRHGRTTCRTKNFATGELLLHFQGCSPARVGSCCSKPKFCPKMESSCSCFSQNRPQKSTAGSSIRSNKAENTIEMENLDSKQHQQQQQQQQLYDLFLADMCTLPGTCTCDPNGCKCPDCIEHNGVKGLNARQGGPAYFISQTNLGIRNDAGLSNTNQPVNNQRNNLLPPSEGVVSFGQVGIQSPIDQSTNQVTMNALDLEEKEARKDCDVKDNSIALAKTARKEPNIPFLDNSPESSVSSRSIPECLCEPSECACYNCEKHGIANGIRIADGARVSYLNEFPTEMQLAYSLPNNGSGQEAQLESLPLTKVDKDNHGHFHKSDVPRVRVELLSDYASEMQYNGALQQASPIGMTGTAPINNIRPTLPENPALSLNQAAKSPNTSTGSKMGEIMIDFSEFDNSCNCADGECTCTNCFKHGRFGNVDIL